MEGRQLRDRDDIARDLVGVIGLSAFLLGLVTLRASKELGFDASDALGGVLDQLAITLPAALLVLGAAVLELMAGLVLARAARRRPFESVADAALAAMVAAVLKGTLLLGLLAGFGLFVAPILIGVDLAILAGGLLLPQISRHVRPLSALGGWRDAVASIGSIPLAALVLIVWAGPVVLQLASPVVPFIDVLPNHVAPVEHLRTFGWFSPLTATQSPIQGSSRNLLGYDGLLGSIATMTNLPGGLAIAGFILPGTLLAAAGAHRLAGALRRGDAPIGPWALLAFALTQPFARLGDVRGTVIVVPLVCFGLAVLAEAIGGRADGRDSAREPRGADPDPAADETGTAAGRRTDDMGDPWRIGRGAAIGLALGAATLVHPVIGFLAIVTAGVVALVRLRELAPVAFVATLTAGLIALPQLTTMLGISLPTVALGAWLPLAAGVGIGAGRVVERRERLRAVLVRLAVLVRVLLVLAAVGGLAFAFAIAALNADRVPAAIEAGVDLALDSSGLLLAVIAVGALLGSRGARSPIVVVGLLVGVAAVLATQLLPGNLGFLGDALRFEVPKTVHYWLSAIAAAGAAAALAHAWTTGRLPWLVRAGAVAGFVAVAAAPLRSEPIDAYHLGEHRWSESFAIDLRWAGRGFWAGFPDSRTLVDEPRQEILDAVRAEIEAGRLRHDTPVLHLARTFQQWVATPLGVFAGVTETFVSLDPEVSQHTAGGRLHGLEDLPGFLSGGGYPYVVLEPDGLPDELRGQVLAAGFASIFANDQGVVFAIAR